jgi:CubicO group peptidase (beta-lactamase class C family)
MTNADVLRALTHVDHTEIHPGEKYQYSNSGYVLLSILVERVSDTPLSEFLQKRILGPLRMLRSFALTSDQQKAEDVARAIVDLGLRTTIRSSSQAMEEFIRRSMTLPINFVANGLRVWNVHGPASHRVFRKKFKLKLRAAGIAPWRRRSGGFVDRKRNTRQAGVRLTGSNESAQFLSPLPRQAKQAFRDGPS